MRVVDANVSLAQLAGRDPTEARIAQAKHDYVTGRLDADQLDERIGAILAGTWPRPPRPCACKEPEEAVEVTTFGGSGRRLLCMACGRSVR